VSQNLSEVDIFNFLSTVQRALLELLTTIKQDSHISVSVILVFRPWKRQLVYFGICAPRPTSYRGCHHRG